MDSEELKNAPIEEQNTAPAESQRIAKRMTPWLRRLLVFHSAPLPCCYRPTEIARNLRHEWLSISSLFQLIVFAALTLIFVAQASIYWLAVIDDSYITFRFVDLFVKGHGWRFNVDGPRVEGFTNFLWAVILVIPHMLRWDLMLCAKVLGLACAVGAMAASWGLAAAIRQRTDLLNLLPAALLATNAHFAHWSLMGLETLLQVMLVTACYYRFERERLDHRLWLISPVLAVLAAMTRVDSLYYLSPLGLYGMWLVWLRYLPIKRFLLWGLIAAVPFSVYTGWRYVYFGDLAPNTYYAKQRFVTFDGHERGMNQLHHYYLAQTTNASPRPSMAIQGIQVPENRILESRIDYFLWKITRGHWHTWAWMNFWLAGLALTLLAMSSRLLFPWKIRKRFPALASVPFGRHCFLILSPWLLNLYYVYHVNGDWMPGYRFFQVALPFIGVAAAAGFGWLIQVSIAIVKPLLPRVIALTGSFLLPVYLLLGTANEQLRINTVYIFGGDSIIPIARETWWSSWSDMVSNYRKGFSAPLPNVSEYLLLNTQDGASVFMSDIGQPLWFADHLSVYDVDGLVDPMLAHAPSRRGDLPNVEDHLADILRERNLESVPTGEFVSYLQQAKQRDFDRHVARNADWIMNECRPDYLLIFINHERPDPTSPGGAYPQISAAVYRHPAMDQYQEVWNTPKVGNAFNHFYIRKDVNPVVSDPVKLERLWRTIERNPRMPQLTLTLYREMKQMTKITEADRIRVLDHVSDTIKRYAKDQVIIQLATLARQFGDRALAREALNQMIKQKGGDLSTYRSLATLYELDGQLDQACRILEEALPLASPTDNQIHFQLAWFHESLGHFTDSRRILLEARDRQPTDPRAWSDLASMLERSSRNPLVDEKLQVFYAGEALEAFREYIRLLGTTPEHVKQVIEQLEARLSDNPKEVSE